ncbi:MAG: metal ABC transporter permease [Acidimicrobiales bacterium]|nr:metal ABC transporter permease [Acidimicrobiales bacterium]
MSALLEPFRFEFFRNGLIVATLAGAICGLIGVYVVLRSLSYIGHGLSHAIFGGAAASAVIGVNFYLGAGLWGLASALLIGRVARRGLVGSDAAIGVITTASFAVGLALANVFGSAQRSIDAVLFGSILGVGPEDVVAVLVAGLLSLAVVWFAYRELLFSTFDPEVAGATGVNVARVEALLMLVLAVTILVTMQVMGVLLISAMLVTPAVIARMLTNSFARMLVLAPIIGALCGFVGMNLSYHIDVSSGATIILVAASAFVVVFGLTGSRGLRRVGSVADVH